MTTEEMLAREAIRGLMHRYATAGDSGRREEFASVFTDDATLQAPGGIDCRGREAIVARLFGACPHAADTTPALPYRFVRHNLTTSDISFSSAEAATGRSYFMVVTDAGLDHSGVYTDEFRREGDDWKLARRVVRLDYISPNSRFDF